MTRLATSFESQGTRCGASHHTATSAALEGPHGRPCVVLGHGFGATRASGLEGFAERFAQAGADALSFDYRHFGDSEGQPRQLVDPKRQRADYAAAIAHARTLPGVDPDRIVVWGCSFAGGHVLQVGAEDLRVAAVISMTPACDGRATLLASIKQNGPAAGAALTAAALRDAASAARGGPPVTVPIAGAPGSASALNAPGAQAGMLAIAGEDWVNEVAARIFLTFGTYRPLRHATKLRCPVLVQVADDDRTAPPAAAMAGAWKARAVVHHYPCDHFDVYPGQEWFEQAVAHQLAFLQRVFAPAAALAV